MSTSPLAVTELGAFSLFEGLGDEELAAWATAIRVSVFAPGEVIVDCGQEPPGLLLLLRGEADAQRIVAGTSDPAIFEAAPTWMGAVAALTGEPSNVRIRARTRCRIGCVETDDFRRMTYAQPIVQARVTSRIAPQVRRDTNSDNSRQQMAALGQMAAGLAHELGNPAAAAGRSIAELADALEVIGSTIAHFVGSGVERAEAEQLVELHRLAVDRASRRTPLDALDAADAEDALRDRLESLTCVAEPWRLAEPLAAAGIDQEWLERVAGLAGPATGAALEWVAATVNARRLAAEIEHCTTRMSEIVTAVKSYSYVDRGDVHEVDLHEGLESTLTILGHKLKRRGIRVVREYERTLANVTARGSELNQVWTNLIDNAIDAAGDAGTITIRTRAEGTCAITEISDDGPGIPDPIADHIFEPFYTTKEIGHGTGLGLATAQRIVVERHHGSLTLRTAPGATTFTVRIPTGHPCG